MTVRYLSLFLAFLFATSLPHAPLAVPVKEKKAAKKGPDFTHQQLLDFFAAISERVKGDYVDDVSNRELLEGALSGMAGSLDPHSMYLNQEKFNELKNSAEGKFGGLGIEILIEDAGIRVISPMEDSPAAKAGIKPGDMIVAIEEEPISSMSGFAALKKLRGDPGTKVKVTIMRDKGVVFDVTLTRAFIKVNPVKSRIEDDIVYIRLATFNEKTTSEIIRAVRRHTKKLGKKVRGFVIDVRNNAGGLLDQAVAASSLFLGEGKQIVSIKGKSKKQLAEFKSNSSDILKGLPIIVLVNGGSASASEILAGALQDHKRAVVVGTRSFGKGSVQRITPLRGIGAIKLTIALYYTPSGRSIQKEGIQPDIVVEQQLDLKTINSSKRLREAYLKDALGNGNKKDKPKETKSVQPNDRDKIKEVMNKKNFKELPDYQLQQAFNILRALTLRDQA